MHHQRAMGPATLAKAVAIALVIVMGAATTTTADDGTTITPSTNSTEMPMFMTNFPKLDRAHKNKLLVEAPCVEQYCKNVRWQIKVAGDKTWRTADAEPHSNFPNTFYVRSLRADTSYVLRALYKRPGSSLVYVKDDLPTLEARTCPEIPPPVSDLHAYSAGPGWLEVRWTPPPKEACKSHLYYQARYAPSGNYFSAWRPYGFYRNDRWVHFRPTHPCAVWPDEFCMLVTDGVKAGEMHVVEVRVSRFDELVLAVSASRKVVVRADTGCVANDTCGVIGGAPVTATFDAGATTKAPSDEVDLDDSDITITTLSSNASLNLDGTTPSPLDVVTKASTRSGESEQEAAEHRTQKTSSQSGNNSLFGRLGGVFLALLLVTCISLPIVYFYGKRRGAREAVELHMVPAWRRRLGGDGGSQPVLVEGIEDGGCENAGATIQVDQHGRYSWAKLLPSQDD